MIILICNIIIFIIAFSLGREYEKECGTVKEIIRLPSQSEAEYLKVEKEGNSITVSSCDKSDGFTVIYDKDTPVDYT